MKNSTIPGIFLIVFNTLLSPLLTPSMINPPVYLPPPPPVYPGVFLKKIKTKVNFHSFNNSLVIIIHQFNNNSDCLCNKTIAKLNTGSVPEINNRSRDGSERYGMEQQHRVMHDRKKSVGNGEPVKGMHI